MPAEPPAAPPPAYAPASAPATSPDTERLDDAADRLMRLIDHVVAQTEGVRARVRQVETSLDLLSRKLSAPATLKHATDVVAEPNPAPADESDRARLMAIEIALSGGSRGEVSDRLTQEFGVADPTPILDDVFGAGSADSSRMPWSS
jgi:hypothetical protein